MVEIYNIFSIIYYDNSCETYKPIVCINKMPNGNLKNHIIRVTNSPLSPFQNNNHNNCNSHCIYAIKSLNNCGNFLDPNNIDELYEFLLNNNYTVNYEFTNLINNGKNQNINTKKLIMFITYN